MAYINPYRQFNGAIVPNWLMRRQEISQGAKLFYARLAQYAGQNDTAWPRREIIATEMGVTASQVDRYVEELKDHALIEVQRRGRSRSNQYRFLDHQWIYESAHMRTQRSHESAKMRSHESAKMRSHESAKMRSPIYEKNHRKRINREERPPSTKNGDIDQEAVKLAEVLSQKIVERYPTVSRIKEDQISEWAKEAQRLNRIDGQSYKNIQNILLWSQTDSFWKATILSMKNLRKHFNQLIAHKKRTEGPSREDRLAELDRIRAEVNGEDKPVEDHDMGAS